MKFVELDIGNYNPDEIAKLLECYGLEVIKDVSKLKISVESIEKLKKQMDELNQVILNN